MKTDSWVILASSILVTAAIIGAAHYLSADNDRARKETLSNPEPLNRAQSPIGDLRVSAETSAARSHEIIQCHDPEMGTFYTNATACDGADLENRISDAQTLSPSLTRDLNNTKQATRRKAASKSNAKNKPNLRLNAEAPPPNLPPECRFPVGKALETERNLAAADDPYESIWKKTYCRFRCEAIVERCPVNDDNFYYSFRRICGGVSHPDCSY